MSEQDSVIERDALDAFLRGRRVAVLAIARDGKPPLAAPIWYDWADGRFRLQVEAASAKARTLARRGGEAPASLTVQSEAPPYRYAVAYGVARLRDAGDAELRRRMARRYFGRVAGDMYVAEEEKQGRHADGLRIIEIVPERFVTHDFGPEAGRLGRAYFAIYRLFHPVRA